MALKSVLEQFQKVKQTIQEENDKKGGDKSYDDNLFFKPKIDKDKEKTKFKLRFLELEDSVTGKPWLQVNYHMFERNGDNKYIKVIDPRTFDPKAENPIADAASKLFATNNPLDKQAAIKLYRKPRYFAKVYVLEAPDSQKEYEGKVLFYEMGKKLFEKLKSQIDDFDTCFWDPYKGKNFLLVAKTVSGDKWPNYDDSNFFGDLCPIGSDTILSSIEKQLEKLPSLKKTLLEKDKIKSGKELRQLMEGGLKSISDDNGATDIVTGEEISSSEVSSDVSFGEVEEPVVTEQPASKKVVEKATKKVDDEFDVEFNEDDFKVD